VRTRSHASIGRTDLAGVSGIRPRRESPGVTRAAARRGSCKPNLRRYAMSRHRHSLPALVGAVSFCFAAAVGAQVTANTHSSSNVGTTAAAPSTSAMDKSSTSAMDKSSTNATDKVSTSDRKFMEKAAKGGMAEVQLGKLATEKANAPEVKQFGQRMVDDHSKANDQLKQLASQKGVTLPTTLDKKSQHEYDRLSKLSGEKFDQEYMKHMVSDHKKDVSEFKSEANKAKDADLKQWAQNTLPVLEQHLTLAQTDQKIANNEGKNSATKTSSTASRKTGS
jgi:putative membrane protein